MQHSANPFSTRNTKVYEISLDYIFYNYYFATKLHSLMKFRMLFSVVLMYFPNSKDYLIGEWSITTTK